MDWRTRDHDRCDAGENKTNKGESGPEGTFPRASRRLPKPNRPTARRDVTTLGQISSDLAKGTEAGRLDCRAIAVPRRLALARRPLCVSAFTLASCPPKRFAGLDDVIVRTPLPAYPGESEAADHQGAAALPDRDLHVRSPN